jgi:hypothetical protein
MVRYKKGVPKRDGSGRGIRANRGRGGCNPPRDMNYFSQWFDALGLRRRFRNRRR